MNHACSFFKIQILLLVVFFVLQPGGFSQESSNPSFLRIERPVSAFQTDKAQLALIEARCNQRDRLIRNLAIMLSLLFLFGAFCAVWAQNEHRNGALWFFAGFVFNIATVLTILFINRRHRHRKRYRRVISYWGI